jgi:hypothetical protein
LDEVFCANLSLFEPFNDAGGCQEFERGHLIRASTDDASDVPFAGECGYKRDLTLK